MTLTKTLALACLATSLALPALAETRVILLGTGTPVPTPDRAGSGLAVIYNDEAFIFDLGPGSVRRIIEAWDDGAIEALYPTNIKQVFISHLHSDHTLDYSELASTYWWRREEKLKATGPVGLKALTEGYYAMQATDIDLRTQGSAPVKNPDFYQVDVTEIAEDGVIYDKDGMTVEAFSVPHGDIDPAYGFKITTPDKTIVFSGDTAFSEAMVEKAKGVDLLIHEVISDEGLNQQTPEWQAYHSATHTRASELAGIANEAQPGLLVLTHVATYGAPADSPKTEIEALYDGKVVLANDLDEF